MISQYLSELDKKYRSNPYSTLKDLQAEHFRLRALLKDMESAFAEKIKLLSLSPTPQSNNKPGPSDPKLPPLLTAKFEMWLQLYAKRNRLRALVAHVTATALSKEKLVETVLQAKSSVPAKDAESKQTIESLESTLDTTSNELRRLRSEYTGNREMLDSRNRSLLSSGGVQSLENTLRTLKAATESEDDKYSKILQQSEALANQLELARVDVQKLMEVDEHRIRQFLDPRSVMLETRYWSLLSQIDRLRSTLSTLEQQKTQYARSLQQTQLRLPENPGQRKEQQTAVCA